MERITKVLFTGDHEQEPDHIIRSEFGNYIVSVRVDSENRFIGIDEIVEKKEFYTFNSKEIRSVLDVQDYYSDK